MAEIIIGLLQDIQQEAVLNEPRNLPFSPDDNILAGRVSRILNAFATTLVHDRRSEVIAVGATVMEEQVTISIATNGDVPRRTRRHAENLWSHLFIISQEFSRWQKQKNSDAYNSGIMSTSPPMTSESCSDETIARNVENLKRSVYGFCFPKFISRLTKGARHESIQKVITLLESRQEVISPKTLGYLKRISKWLDRVFELVGLEYPKIPKKQAFQSFVTAMDSIDIIVRLVLKDEDCVRVLNFLDGKQKTVVLHYLTKLGSLPSSINTLIKFTYSPRMRARFFNGQKVLIDPVPNQRRAIILPNSPDEYEKLVKGLSRDRGLILKPGEGRPGRRVLSEYTKSTSKVPIIKSATHCECALALHQLRSSPDSIPFLGCSKLSCFSCWSFLQSLNDAMGTKFQTKGTHGNVYFPWRYPEEMMSDFPGNLQKTKNFFYDRIMTRYIDCLLACRKAETGSESSTELEDMPGTLEDADNSWG